MSEELFTRLLWAAAILLSGAAAYLLVTRYILLRAGRKRLGSELLRPGLPAILYFTTPDCAPCKTIQRPALQALQRRLDGRIQVIEIDAAQRPDLSDSWGVLSVPTTFIIDAQGRPRHVNHGVAGAEKLLRQLEQAGQNL